MLIAVADIPRFSPDSLNFIPRLTPYVTALMLRGKNLSPRTLLQWGQAIRTRAPRLPLIVNDRLEVASMLCAKGLHLPAGALPAQTMRQWWTGQLSASIHSVEELDGHAGADFYLWGNAFPTRSKPGAPARNREGLSAIVARCRKPILAIGGITVANVDDLAGWGLSGVAVADGIWQSSDPVASAREIALRITRPEWGVETTDGTDHQWGVADL